MELNRDVVPRCAFEIKFQVTSAGYRRQEYLPFIITTFFAAYASTMDNPSELRFRDGRPLLEICKVPEVYPS